MKALVLTLMASVALASVAAAAAPLTPGNVVISDPFHLGHSLLEYRPDGTLVQTIEIPQPSYGGDAGGIAFDNQGFLWIYNGNTEPYLSSWNSLNIWTHQSCPGWSSFLCYPCQGIGIFGNFVFVTDEGAYGNPNGLIRFDRDGTDPCVRFADGRNYSALAIGLDGVLYALRADDVSPPPPTVIDAFDPTTLGFIKSITLSDRSLSIAADAQGQLYGASGQSILHYSADGSLLDTHQVITNGFLYTLAFSSDGRFVVVSMDGEVVIADRTFTPLNRFTVPVATWAYAAIVPPRPSNYADGYLPLVPGTIWNYLKNGQQTVTREVLNEKVDVGGVATTPVKFVEENVTEYLTSDSNGIFLHREYQPHIYVSGVGWVDIDATFIPPIKLSEGEIWIGQSFHSSGTARTLVLPIGWTFNFDYTADSTIEAEETVTVPAGTFDTIRWRGSITIYGQTLSMTRYLAKGIGIVKDVSTNPQGETATSELISYLIGGANFLTVQKIYIGYYQRPADPGGLLYWAGRLDATGGNLTEIIEAYANSPESQALYGTINSSNISSVVNGIYNALFGRDAEAEGLNWYVNGFNSGKYTPATIMLNVLYGAQNEDLQSVNNKLAAANLFTWTIDPDLDGASFLATYSGDADAQKARDFLSTVGWDAATIPTQADVTLFIKNNIADPGDPILNLP